MRTRQSASDEKLGARGRCHAAARAMAFPPRRRAARPCRSYRASLAGVEVSHPDIPLISRRTLAMPAVAADGARFVRRLLSPGGPEHAPDRSRTRLRSTKGGGHAQAIWKSPRARQDGLAQRASFRWALRARWRPTRRNSRELGLSDRGCGARLYCGGGRRLEPASDCNAQRAARGVDRSRHRDSWR